MEDFFNEPETQVVLKMMANYQDTQAQIPFFVDGVSFNLTFVYLWIYIWGLSFPRLAEFLKLPENKLFDVIRDFVNGIKEKIGLIPIGESSANKTSDLVAVTPPHTSIVLQSFFEESDL